MDLTHIIIAGITSALNLAALVIPSGSPWHGLVIGAVAILGGLSALVAGHQSGSVSLSTSSSALHTGSAPSSPAPKPAGPVVLQGPPPVDQEGLP